MLAVDVLPPLIPGADFLYLGPAGLVALVVVIALAVLLVRWLRKRGKGWPLSIAVGLAAFLVIDLIVYFLVVPGFRVHPRPPKI